MSQALRDLPDPLLPPPALPSSSPDDLLAKMADEAIDQLMAAADTGQPAVLPPQPVDAAAVAATGPDDDDGFEADEPPPDYHAATPLPSVVAVVAAPAAAPAVDALPTETEPAAAAPPVVEELVAPAPSAESSPIPAEAAPPPAVDVKALLLEAPPSRSGSPLLWPLRVLNAPFANLGDGARAFVGLLGFVTLVPAIAAIVYVFFMKR